LPRTVRRGPCSVNYYAGCGGIKGCPCRADGTHAEPADHPRKTDGIEASKAAVQGVWRPAGIRPYRPTYRVLGGKGKGG
jgi:hypothetical protein